MIAMYEKCRDELIAGRDKLIAAGNERESELEVPIGQLNQMISTLKAKQDAPPLTREEARREIVRLIMSPPPGMASDPDYKKLAAHFGITPNDSEIPS
jgi:hypothetical protein